MDHSESCLYLGYCGCAYDAIEQLEDISDEEYGYANEDVEFLDQQLLEEQNPAEFWHPESRDCLCCKGFRYSCQGETCKLTNQCKCQHSFSMCLEKMVKLAEFADRNGYYPFTDAEMLKLEPDQRLVAETIKLDILKLNFEEKPIAELAKLLILFAVDYPKHVELYCKFFTSKLFKIDPVLREEKKSFKHQLLNAIHTTCMPITRKSTKTIDTSLNECTSILSIAFYCYTKAIFTMLDNFLDDSADIERICKICTQLHPLLKKYPDILLQFHSKLDSFQTPENEHAITAFKKL